jgi:hypothetical protein
MARDCGKPSLLPLSPRTIPLRRSRADHTPPGVIAELEKLGSKYRIALRIAKDERWERLECGHKGVYADDCIVERVMKHKVYIVATNDRDLKRRVRKVPGSSCLPAHASIARPRHGHMEGDPHIAPPTLVIC